MRFIPRAAAVVLALLPLKSPGLGPHEVMVIANGRSVDSLRVAGEFMRLRSVPDCNLVAVDLPSVRGEPPIQLSPSEFERAVWAPVNRAVAERGLDSQILAWVYSSDLPVRIVGVHPAVSILGLTFVRNRLPAGGIQEGSYASPLFGGLSGETAALPETFDTQAEWLRRKMPLPSMMLGYSGRRGNTTDTVLECLRRGASADGRFPTGTVYFVKSDDIRSRCRHWQFVPAARELEARGIAAEVVWNMPPEGVPMLGIQMGQADVTTPRSGLLPGSMAEHLTSVGAAFDSPLQTKITAWIRAGATTSAGTVVEPLSNWAKFPHARFWTYYSAGCTTLESYYQAIRCPLQILILGDPLCAPWAPRGRVQVFSERGWMGGGTVRIRAVAENPERYGRYMVLVNGVRKAEGADVEMPWSRFREGTNVVRVVAYRRGLVRVQAFGETTVVRPEGSSR